MADDYGVKISLPGVDVKTATPEECAIHSSFPHLKVALVDQRTVTSDGTTNQIVNAAHGLGYVPAFMSYVNTSAMPAGEWHILPIGIGGMDGISVSADNTNVSYDIFNYPAGITVNFKSYIFYDIGD